MRAFDSYVLAAVVCVLSTSCSFQERDVDHNTGLSVEFVPDETNLVRNPLSGWVLYDDANDYVSVAADYWRAQDAAASRFGSIFYWRSRWSELEPEEGEYAWEQDENFKELIKGALDRGLKLAFHIYVDGQDNIYNGTPDFVREAGAEGYPVHRLWDPEGVDNNWTPYADDPVFQEKFSNFIRAFAEEFDEPSKVDFIDGFNLGWWGEGHHIRYKDSGNKAQVFQWITDLYGNNFKKVILVTNFGTEMGIDMEKRFAIEKHGYIIRRNSLGSTWFRDVEIETVMSLFPEVAFISEGCYWGGYSDEYQPWSEDPLYKDVFRSWPDYYRQVYDDAIRSRANTLDLREIKETQGWTKRALDLVKAFVSNGGYRLSPLKVTFPETIFSGERFTISHTWRNSGVGVCPNNNIRWNYKYKVAFAFMDVDSKEIRCIAVDHDAEPSVWMKGKDTHYDFTSAIDLPSGDYIMSLAIVDTSLDRLAPGLNLAVKDGCFHDGWLEISEVAVR